MCVRVCAYVLVCVCVCIASVNFKSHNDDSVGIKPF